MEEKEENNNILLNLTSVLEDDDDDYNNNNQAQNSLQKESWIKICVLALIFCLAAFENVCLLISIVKTIKRRSSPMFILLFHLGIADSLVVFSIIPSEILSRLFQFSFAGDFLCKALHFLRGFSLILSGCIMICISVDRFYAIIWPLLSIRAPQRIKHILFWAWFMSFVTATPQLLVFRSANTTTASDQQCQSTWMGREIKMGSELLQMTCECIIPLLVILYTYTRILYRISNTNVTVYSEANNLYLRRTGQTVLDRAKINTVKMTLVLVGTFIVCRSFYMVMPFWTLIDEETANTMVNPYIKDILFHAVVLNTCVNALVYGIYAKSTTSDPSRISTSATNTIELHTHSVCLNRDSRRKHSL